MRKLIAVTSILFASSVVFAEVDLSGLYSQTTKPTVSKIKKEYAQFKKSLKGLKLSEAQKKALAKLEKSMKEHVVPATLKRQSSRGPGWKDEAIDYLETQYDVHENVSYTDEDGEATEGCNFEIDSITEMDDHKWSWDSVKPIRGSTKSVAYIVELIVPLRGKDKDSNRMKWCDHVRSEYAFDAKLDDGGPVEIDW